jgi:hypothetical protein
MRRRRRLSRLEIFYATVTAGLMVGASLWLDRNGLPVTGRVAAKQERIVVGHEPSGEWRRYYEVGAAFELPGGGGSQATVRVPQKRYDALRAGDPIELRYLPQFPLLARTTDRSTASVVRELAWGLAGIPILVWLAGGLLVLWIAARMGTVPVLAAGAAWLAAGYSLLLSLPSREGPRPAQAMAQVRGVTLVDKSPGRTHRARGRTGGFNRRLEVPYQVVELLVPVRGSRDTCSRWTRLTRAAWPDWRRAWCCRFAWTRPRHATRSSLAAPGDSWRRTGITSSSRSSGAGSSARWRASRTAGGGVSGKRRCRRRPWLERVRRSRRERSCCC